MDKILLTAFLSALAGFITAVISIVKLVNEKESKTTDYRQSWTDSVRGELATLIGLLNAQAGNMANSNRTAKKFIEIHRREVSEKEEQLHENTTVHIQHNLKEIQGLIRETRQEIYQSYARARLHFKPDDISFNRVEQHFNVIDTLLDQLHRSTDPEETATLREKVYATTNEMSGFCRQILKAEWETVKKGEHAYQMTKKWSIAGSIIMLFILLSIGIHAGISMWRADLLSSDGAAHTPSLANEEHHSPTRPLSLGETRAPEMTVGPHGKPIGMSQVSNITLCTIPTTAPLKTQNAKKTLQGDPANLCENARVSK